MNKNEIMVGVKDHYNYLKELYPENQILGVFLYGSQNYGTDTNLSDIDTKAILIPSFQELCLEKPVSKSFIIPTGEQCEVKDIREMVYNFRKQNMNFLEILYTEYKILNPKYEYLWNEFFVSNREKIARYDTKKAVTSAAGQAKHTLLQNPEDGKKLSNAFRMYLAIENYIENKSYAECIYLPQDTRENLKQLKIDKTKALVPRVDFLVDYFTTCLYYPETKVKVTSEKQKQEIDKFMNDGIIALLRKNVYEI